MTLKSFENSNYLWTRLLSAYAVFFSRWAKNGLGMFGTIYPMLLLFGCSNHIEPESECPPSMKGIIVIDEVEYPLEEGSFKWERKKGAKTEVIQTDHASPDQLASQLEPIIVEPNEKAEIQIEGNPHMTLYLWNEKGREKEIELIENQLIVPSVKGEYIYEVLAEWPQGTVSYTFVTKISPSP